MVSLFDIIGPVMVGPSSSHTAGACRLGLIARAILGATPEAARIQLHGSFAATGEGHGTHRAILGGLVGIEPDDFRLRDAYEVAHQHGLEWTLETVDLGADAHPNTVLFHLRRGTAEVVVRGASIGGGRIEVSMIDAFPVALDGAYHTLVVLGHDEPGTIAAVANRFACDGVNLARMRVDRAGRNRDALMTIEADGPISDDALAEVLSYPWVRWARGIEKIA